MWNEIKQVWHDAFAEYKVEWKQRWNEYKTIVIPFIKGCFSYVWQLVYGMIKLLAKGIFGTGKIILEYIIKALEKA